MPSGKSAAGDDDRAVPEPPLEVRDLLRHGFALRARRAEVAMQRAAVVSRLQAGSGVLDRVQECIPRLGPSGERLGEAVAALQPAGGQFLEIAPSQ
jgi:hypothetical protein